MNEYETLKNRPVKYMQMMGSAAHTYGNALAYIQKWIIDLFPKRDTGDSIFKTIHISSKLAHKQLRSTTHEMGKKTKPILAIRPRIEFNEDKFLQGTPVTDKLIQNQINYGKEALQPFFFDKKNKIAIKYQLNRVVMNVDVIMVFSTLMQQINYATYLKNSVAIGHPFTLKTCLESYLSLEMMNIVSELSGVPIKDSSGTVKQFLRYMNQNSINPVTYKLQGSTNSNEFYRYYPVTIDTLIPSFDTDDGETIDHVKDNYQISFPIRMEFYTTGFYFLFSDKMFNIKKPSIPEDSTIIPVFTDVILEEDLNLSVGWNLYTRVSARLDKENDIINFKEILSPSIIAATTYCINTGNPTDEIIEIKIRKQGELLVPGKDFRVDFSTYDICFNNREFGYYTYTIMICINIENINQLITEVYNLK